MRAAFMIRLTMSPLFSSILTLSSRAFFQNKQSSVFKKHFSIRIYQPERKRFPQMKFGVFQFMPRGLVCAFFNTRWSQIRRFRIVMLLKNHYAESRNDSGKYPLIRINFLNLFYKYER